MKTEKRRRFFWAMAALVLAGAFVTAGCPMPLDTDLLTDVKQRVDEYNKADEPDIVVLTGGAEVLDGTSTDAFADAVGGVPFDVEFTIRNDGAADLHLNETDPILISGLDAGLFSVLVPPGNLLLGPGESTTFTIRFVLDDAGSKTAELAVYSDDPDENPYGFTLSNTALPEIQLLQGVTEINSPDGSYDFGTVVYGQYLDVTFTIENRGQWYLDLTDTPLVSVSGDGFSVADQPDATIDPLSSTTFTLRFEPVTPAGSAGSVTIANTDSNEDPYTFDLSGSCELPVTELDLAAGMFHSVAVKSNGTVWAWGTNDHGELGDGSTAARSGPVQVAGLTGVSAAAAGRYHSAAVKSDGTVWAWGLNDNGQLGDGTTTNRAAPVKVSGLSGVTDVAVGGAHTVALKGDGTVWAWGNNNNGQLGDDTTTDRYLPVQASGLANVVAIAAAASHTMAVKSDGTIWTWGYNFNGRLGDGTTTDRHTPVEISGPPHTADISAESFHTVALTSDGSIWAWGRNDYGQLGDGTTNQSLVPVLAGEIFRLW